MINNRHMNKCKIKHDQQCCYYSRGTPVNNTQQQSVGKNGLSAPILIAVDFTEVLWHQICKYLCGHIAHLKIKKILTVVIFQRCWSTLVKVPSSRKKFSQLKCSQQFLYQRKRYCSIKLDAKWGCGCRHTVNF